MAAAALFLAAALVQARKHAGARASPISAAPAPVYLLVMGADLTVAAALVFHVAVEDSL